MTSFVHILYSGLSEATGHKVRGIGGSYGKGLSGYIYPELAAKVKG